MDNHNRIEFVGLDVAKRFLRPGRYVVASYANDEDDRYTPHHWWFKLVGRLQVTYECLMDDGTGAFFANLTPDGTWKVRYYGWSRGEREFSDIWTMNITNEGEDTDD